MCGIVGYIGSRDATAILLEGLRRLEYRGYDSAGIATRDARGNVTTVKEVGRIDALAKKVETVGAHGSLGIGHTRWATHGGTTVANAHPHLGGDGGIVVVHNGVIENYRELKDQLEVEGYRFVSQTDTEVAAHLLDSVLRANPDLAAAKTEAELRTVISDSLMEMTSRLRGTYGLAILLKELPDTIVVARQGSPLVIGVGHGENLVASDASALAGHAEQIVYLNDREFAFVTSTDIEVIHRETGRVEPNIHKLALVADDVGLQGFPHYMLKEIYEQPESIRNAMRGRINVDDATAVFGGLNLTPQDLRRVERIVLTACGTSWHAALVGEYLFEEIARIPVEVEYASELRYRNPPVENGTLLFAITQSGETADTLAAMREMRRKGIPTLAICNVVGSTIAREAMGGVYLHAGPEIGVASTKAFTSQVTVLGLLALYFGRMRNISYEAGTRLLKHFQTLPSLVEQTLQCDKAVKRIAQKFAHMNNFLYLGRQYSFPTALEGALKLKEISYIHAEGYPAAEMKHGPIALVDAHTPSVFIMPQGPIYDKVMSNLEEIKARGGPVIAIACEGDNRIAQLTEDVIYVPHAEEFLQAIVTSIPLQLLAYHIAVIRGCDVDKPRNLAKSVTVE